MRDYFFTKRFNFVDVIGFFITVAVFDHFMTTSNFIVAILAAFGVVLVISFISVMGERWDDIRKDWKDIYGD